MCRMNGREREKKKFLFCPETRQVGSEFLEYF